MTQQAASDPNSFLSGYHWADLKKQLEAAGLGLSDLHDAAQKLGITWDDNHLAESFTALARALRELDLKKALGTFQGQMGLLQHEFSIFNVTDPVQKLEKFRQLLLSFTSLPGGLQQQLAGLDLTTAAGQTQLQQILEQLFSAFASGRISIAQLQGAQGGLSASDFQDLLDQMAQLLQQAQGASGNVGGLQVFSGISELQANRLLSGDDTKIALLSKLVEINAAGFRGLGVDIPSPGDLAPLARPGGAASTTVTFQPGSIEIGPIDLAGVSDPKAAGQALGDAFVREIDRRLYAKRVSASRVQGRVS